MKNIKKSVKKNVKKHKKFKFSYPEINNVKDLLKSVMTVPKGFSLSEIKVSGDIRIEIAKEILNLINSSGYFSYDIAQKCDTKVEVGASMDSVSYLFCRVLKDDKFEDFAGTDIVNKKDISKLFYIIPNLSLSSLNTILSLMECLTDTSRCSYMELSDKTFKDLFLNGWFEYSLSKQDENGSEKLRFKTKFERTKRLKEVMKYFIDKDAEKTGRIW